MSYRPVDEVFWTDPKVRALSVEEKFLFLYFITNPQASFSGVYYLPFPTVLFETGMAEIPIREGINTLSVGYMVLHDEANSMFWVVNMAKFQATSKPQQEGVRKHFKTLQKSPLLRMFAEKYPDIIDPSSYPPDTLPIPSPVPTDTKERERDTERELKRELKIAASKSKAGKTKDLFEKDSINGWKVWIDANREIGRSDPIPLPKNLGIAGNIAKHFKSEDELRPLMVAFLQDNDPFVIKNGHAIGLFLDRVEKYRNDAYEDPNVAVDMGDSYGPMTPAERAAKTKQINDDMDRMDAEEAAKP